MKNSVVKCWLGLSVFGILAGCGKPINKSELPGTYVADFGFAMDSLTLKEDCQFVQTIKIKADGRVVVKSSTWKFRPEEQDIVVSSNYMLVVDGFSQMKTNFDSPNTNSFVLGPIRRRWGKLEIGGDDWLWGRTGVEAPYKKQKQPATPAK